MLHKDWLAGFVATHDIVHTVFPLLPIHMAMMEATMFQGDTHIPSLEFHKALHYLKNNNKFLPFLFNLLSIVFWSFSTQTLGISTIHHNLLSYIWLSKDILYTILRTQIGILPLVIISNLYADFKNSVCPSYRVKIIIL